MALTQKPMPEYLKAWPERMKLLQALGKRSWSAGDKLISVDSLNDHVLDLHHIFEPKCLDTFTDLKDFVVHFERPKKIPASMKSSHFLPGPLFLKTAAWGNNEVLVQL